MGASNNSEFLYEVILLGSIAAILILILILTIINSVKIKSVNNKYKRLMTSQTCSNLEEIIDDCISKTVNIEKQNLDMINSMNKIQEELTSCVQKVSVVRYNAFEDTGSDLSYSVALLDANDSGVVFTSIYSRDSSTTYSKPIINGKSKYPLSVEEIKAINDAIRKSRKTQLLTKEKEND